MSSLNGEHTRRWYAIHTHRKQENRAESNLIAWNVETYAPKYRAERRNPSRSRPIYSVKPLFTGYIFAHFAARAEMLHKIRYTRGVRGIVSMGTNPVPLDDAVIEIIMLRQDRDGFVKLADEMKSGDEVVINGGLFSGFVGVFERRLKDVERVAILLNTLYQFRVLVPEANVNKRVTAAPDFFDA